MKRNLFALISVVLSLSGFSVSTLSAATDYKEHKFQDGIYTVRADKKAEKSAVSASKENAAALVAATRSSNIYEQEAGAGIKMALGTDNILNGVNSGSQVIVLNITDPFYYYDWWYTPYWYSWSPFWRPWDPFWYDRWRWGWGPYYVGPWGPWGPWPYGPDPWWPGYRPVPVYPVYPAHPVGTFATAARGGHHNMSASGLNRRIATPAGGTAGALALGTGSRVAAAGRTSQSGRAVSRVPSQRVTPVGTSVRGSKVVTPARRQTSGTTAVTPARLQPAAATTVSPSRRQGVTASGRTAPATRAVARSEGQGRTPNVKINRNVRSTGSSGSSYSGASSSSVSRTYSRSSSYSGSTSRSGSYSPSPSHSGGSFSGGGSRGFSGGGMSRSVSGGGHGRR